MKKNFVVAIDGIAGAGKSTVATAVAYALGFKKLNTGDIYRAITLKYLETGASIVDDKSAEEFVSNLNIEVKYKRNGEQHTYVDFADRTGDLHSFKVSNTVSTISGYKALREYTVKIQREIASKTNIVVEGRDIGSHVLPNADVKIFLTASVEARAQRQLLELRGKGDTTTTFEQLEASIKQRDYNDRNRVYGALKITDDAHVIDTSNLSIQQVVDRVLAIVEDNR